MPILQITTDVTGLVGVHPAQIYIDTDDTYAEVTVTGYLSASASQGFVFNNKQIALVATSDVGNQFLQISASRDGVVSLTTPVIPELIIDELTLGANGDSGLLTIYPATLSKGTFVIGATNNTGNTATTLTNAAMGQASTISIPDPGASTANFILSKAATSPQTMSSGLTLTGASSDFQTLGGGDILAGASAAAGSVFSYPTTATSGRLELRGVNNAGDFTVTVANASHAQSTVVSIPDAGAATANFILSATAAGTQSIGTGISIVGANNVQTTGGGNFIAGASGADGIFVSFPATATSGTLNLAAVTNASGDFDTTISNAAAVAQDQVLSIPDVGAATGQFLVKTAALVSGNLISASGTAGVTVDSTIVATNVQLKTEIKAVSDSWAGGGTAHSFTVAGATSSSIIVASIASAANASYIVSALPNTGAVDVVFNVDPGAVVIKAIAFIVAQ